MNNLVILSLLLLLGFLFHCLKGAKNAVAAGVSPTMGAWFIKLWVPLVIRFGIFLGLFLIYVGDPNLANKLLSWSGITLTYAAPITKLTAVFAGYLADDVLDFIDSKLPKGLSREIPKYE